MPLHLYYVVDETIALFNCIQRMLIKLWNVKTRKPQQPAIVRNILIFQSRISARKMARDDSKQSIWRRWCHCGQLDPVTFRIKLLYGSGARNVTALIGVHILIHTLIQQPKCEQGVLFVLYRSNRTIFKLVFFREILFVSETGFVWCAKRFVLLKFIFILMNIV